MLDVLGREEFVETVFDVMLKVSERKSSISLAIDGKWGIGKSFVLDMLMESLEIYQSEETNTNRFLVIRYNSWEYDYYDEPIVAILAAVQDSLSKQDFDCKFKGYKDVICDVALTGLKNAANQLLRNKTGIDVQATFGNVESKGSHVDSLSVLRGAIELIRDNIKRISENITVVIMIDELDRCMPDYAIKILNRCNHLFDGIDNVQLLYAINEEQLSYSIKKILGEDTDVDNYLRKFIDSRFILGRGTVDTELITKYRQYFDCFELFNDDGLKADIVPFIDAMGYDIRTTEKLMDKIVMAHHRLQTDICDPALLLFEVTMAFLSFGNERDFVIPNYDSNNHTLVLGISYSSNEKLNSMMEDWSYSGINQYRVIMESGEYRYSILDNIYGKLIYCYSKVIKLGKCTAFTRDNEIEELTKASTDFWKLYCILK